MKKLNTVATLNYMKQFIDCKDIVEDWKMKFKRYFKNYYLADDSKIYHEDGREAYWEFTKEEKKILIFKYFLGSNWLTREEYIKLPKEEQDNI